MSSNGAMCAATLKPDASQDEELCVVSFDPRGAMTSKPNLDFDDLVISWHDGKMNQHGTAACSNQNEKEAYAPEGRLSESMLPSTIDATYDEKMDQHARSSQNEKGIYTSEGRLNLSAQGAYYLSESMLASTIEATSESEHKRNLSLKVSDGRESVLKLRFTTIKKQGKLRRWRVSAPTSAIGAIFLVLGQCLVLVYGYPHPVSVLGHITYVLGFPILLLSLLPSDRMSIRIVSGLLILLLIVDSLAGRISNWLHGIRWMSDDCTSYGISVPCDLTKYELFMQSICIVSNAILLVFAGRGFRRTPAKHLRTIWVCGCFWCMNTGFWNNIVWESVSRICGSIPELPFAGLGCGCFSVITGSIFIQKPFRARAQAWLAALGEATTAAAGISELIAEQSVMGVITKARNTFYCVTADRILKEDFATSTPDSSLHALTEKAFFGGVDAFLSHSWHDDALQKWDALQAWRAKFKAKENREPRLWIDKYCLDQTDINDSLSCLPVYLSGCQQVIVLRGPTYLKRLWCIIELYIFLQMHGNVEDLKVYTLGSLEEVAQMHVAVEQFNVFEAECSLPRDTERLLAAIEAGSGGSSQLEELVKISFREREVMWRQEEHPI